MTEYKENAVKNFLRSSRLTLLGFVDDKLAEVRYRFKTLFEEVDKGFDSFYENVNVLENVNEISTLLQEINVISKSCKRLERTKILNYSKFQSF